jgi:CBS domain-containing protein
MPMRIRNHTTKKCRIHFYIPETNAIILLTLKHVEYLLRLREVLLPAALFPKSLGQLIRLGEFLSDEAARVREVTKGVAMKNATAKDIMTRNVLRVREDMTIHELATFLTEHEITGAPVENDQGKLVGVVSVWDLALIEAERATIDVEHTNTNLFPGLKRKLNREDAQNLHVEDEGLLVKDIMTPVAYTIPEDTAVPEIAKTMVAGRVHRLIVTRDNHMVGIVTTMDLLKLLVDKA